MIARQVSLFGDSILKGIQLDPQSLRYRVNNHIDLDMLSRKYSLLIENFAKFGHTIIKGRQALLNHLERNLSCDVVVMDYGGNDCDFDWKAIAENPDADHLPHTPLHDFTDAYHHIIGTLKAKGILPIITTLPPLEPKNFFNWFCGSLNRENILKWLGSCNAIYRFHETYSRAIERIAHDADVPLVDLRGAFLQNRKIDGLLCADGTHPNTAGQAVITRAFAEFAGRRLGIA